MISRKGLPDLNPSSVQLLSRSLSIMMKCPLLVRREVLPQMEEFKYLGYSLFTSGGRIKREIDRQIGAALAVTWILNQSIVLQRAELQGKVLDLLVNLPSNSHLWS